EQVADLADAEGLRLWQFAAGGGHQAVVRLHDGIGRQRGWVALLPLAGRWLALGVLAELVAPVANLDEPGVLGGTVPRMIRTHEQTPCDPRVSREVCSFGQPPLPRALALCVFRYYPACLAGVSYPVSYPTFGRKKQGPTQLVVTPALAMSGRL